MDWAPFTAEVVDQGFGGSRGGSQIDGFIIHHVAGTNGFGYVANANSRDSHPTYHLDNAGTLRGIVHPDRRPYSTGHGVDQRCVTIEIDNSSVGGEWPISDAAMNTLIELIAWQARAAGKTHAALNVRGQEQSEFFVGWHQQYVATACPGPYIINRLGWIIEQVNLKLNPPPAPPPPPVVPPVPTWYEFEPEREMLVVAPVDVIDIVTGIKKGETLQPGTRVIISSDATTGDGVRYFRSKYSESRAFNWGMDARAFVELVAAVEEPPIEQPPTDPPPAPTEPEEPPMPTKPPLTDAQLERLLTLADSSPIEKPEQPVVPDRIAKPLWLVFALVTANAAPVVGMSLLNWEAWGPEVGGQLVALLVSWAGANASILGLSRFAKTKG